MQQMIRYECNGQLYRWPIPFAYTDRDQIGVRLCTAEGFERVAEFEKDYIIDGQNVISLQPSGMSLVIWQKTRAPDAASLARAAASQPARAAAQPVAESGPVCIPANDESEKAELSLELQQAELAIQKAAADAIERMKQELANSIAAGLLSLENSASQNIERQRLASAEALNREQELAKALDGRAEQVSRAAAMAESASQTISASHAIQENAAITAQGWASASQKSADESHDAACSAWDAATQASIHARRPGISAVHSMDDIHACSPGLFIINPHLTHAPTPFFGVWPARTVDDMQWDAVFFISPYLYPDDPRLPPKRPAKPDPDPVVATGTGDEWIPCQHSHQTPPDARVCACGSSGNA